MNQVNSQIYHRLTELFDLHLVMDKNCVLEQDWIKIINFAPDNEFFYLIKITFGQKQFIVRVWQNHQAEAVMYFDTDWHNIYNLRGGVELPNQKLRDQVNQKLFSLLS